MEKLIKIEKINEDGDKVIKGVPYNFYSMYINMGWKQFEKKKEPKVNFKPINIKEDKD